jgi:hypothetical protein
VTTFTLVQDHKFSIEELESMMPWERLVFITLVQQRVEKENERIRQQNIEMQNKQARKRKR